MLDASLMAINGNSGNSMIAHALDRFLDLDPQNGLKNVFDEAQLALLDVDAVNAEYSSVIFTLQDQVRSDAGGLPWESVTSFVEGLKIPLVIFSLGANTIKLSASELAHSLPANLVRFLNVIDHHAAGVGIRGSFTAEVLHSLGMRNFTILGCPAWFAAGPDRIVPFPDFNRTLPIIGTGLFAHPDAADIHFVLQDERLFLQCLYAGTRPGILEAAALSSHYRGYAATALDAFFRDRMRFFINPDAWVNALRSGYLCAVGTRIHGSFAAMNAGLPALCTAGDMRSQEMCELFRLPHRSGLCAADLPLEELYNACDPQAANSFYPQHYAVFTSWLTQMGLPNVWRPTPPTWTIPEVATSSSMEQRYRMADAIISRFVGK